LSCWGWLRGDVLAADDPGGPRLAPGGRIAMDRPPGGGSVDQGDQPAVGCVDLLRIARLDSLVEASEERLDLRAVAQVLEALARRRSHSLGLLLRVGHRIPS